ncbi:MAG: metallophosphoesterase [Paracoccaceae bacterium]|nr:MAG: metallophosphoesterase [Paracoccaceae bacterium]
MRLLFLGDVVGRPGRSAIAAHLPRLKAEWRIDFVVVNGENATSGAGLTAAHADALFAAGADCVTLGDHAFDQREMLSHIEREPRILRPLNIAPRAPGQGARVFETRQGHRVLVAQVLGRVFMRQPYDDPFSALQEVLARHVLGGGVQAAVIDIHAEATSEKMALGHWCDGRASLAVGTHTHVPTADTMLLAGGTAYQTDAGMCGVYEGVIGMDRAEPMRRFVTGLPGGRFTPAAGEAALCGVFVETDDATGRARAVAPVRLGGRLIQSGPE